MFDKMEVWEAVVADDGRTYYWNMSTNDVSWEKPILCDTTIVLEGDEDPLRAQVHATDAGTSLSTSSGMDDGCIDCSSTLKYYKCTDHHECTDEEEGMYANDNAQTEMPTDHVEGSVAHIPTPPRPPPLKSLTAYSHSVANKPSKLKVQLRLSHRNYTPAPVRANLLICSGGNIVDQLWQSLQMKMDCVDETLERLRAKSCESCILTIIHQSMRRMLQLWKDACFARDTSSEGISLILRVMADQLKTHRTKKMISCLRCIDRTSLQIFWNVWRRHASTTSVCTQPDPDVLKTAMHFGSAVFKQYASIASRFDECKHELREENARMQIKYEHLKKEYDLMLRLFVELKTTRAVESFEHLRQKKRS
jgi:hypothetical protein